MIKDKVKVFGFYINRKKPLKIWGQPYEESAFLEPILKSAQFMKNLGFEVWIRNSKADKWGNKYFLFIKREHIYKKKPLLRKVSRKKGKLLPQKNQNLIK